MKIDFPTCTKCKAPMRHSKAGNLYCSKLCWKDKKEIKGFDTPPTIQEMQDDIDARGGFTK